MIGASTRSLVQATRIDPSEAAKANQGGEVNSIGKAIGYGVLVWLIPFAVSFVIFPLRASNRPLFESLMPVAVVAAVVVFGAAYLRAAGSTSAREGLTVGALWLGISLAIDAPLMLLGGPMQMSVGDYMADIGLTYLIIPIMTTGLAAARADERSDDTRDPA